MQQIQNVETECDVIPTVHLAFACKRPAWHAITPRRNGVYKSRAERDAACVYLGSLARLTSSLMETKQLRSLVLVVSLLSAVDLSFSSNPPSISPLSFPVADGAYRSPAAPPPGSLSSSPSPYAQNHLSPPAPPPETPPSPAPTPSSPNVEEQDMRSEEREEPRENEGGGGMSAGEKMATALGVIIGAALLAAAAVVYKKRRDNTRRWQYGYAAREQML